MHILQIRDKDSNFTPIPAIKGDAGKSAYEQAKEGGYSGTEEEFIALLNGLTNPEGLVPIVNATSTDGITYTATVEGITSLKKGMMIVFVPNKSSTSKKPTLDINGLGEKRIYLSENTSTQLTRDLTHNSYYFSSNSPCLLLYSGASWKTVTDFNDKETDIMVGQYTGTGNCGSENPNLIHCSSCPYIVIIAPQGVGDVQNKHAPVILIRDCVSTYLMGSTGGADITYMFDYNAESGCVAWWAGDACSQLNTPNVDYLWIAFGSMWLKA